MLALLAICWAGAIVFVDPRGEFPTNDEWAYLTTVRILLAEGRFVHHDWISTNLLTHTVWGSLFAAPFGATFQTLRASSLVAGLAGGLALYGTLRAIGRRPAFAGFGAACLMFNPMYLSLSFMFMTDVPYLTLQMSAMLALAVGIARRQRVLFAAGWLAGIAALLARQIGMVVPAAFAAGHVWAKGWSIRSLAMAISPAIAFLLIQRGYDHWVTRDGIAPLMFGYNIKLMSEFAAKSWLQIAQTFPIYIAALYFYLGLFLAPLSIPIFGRTIGRWPRAWSLGAWLTVAACSLAATVAILMLERPFPFWLHLLAPWGLGIEHIGPLAPVWLRVGATGIGALGGACGCFLLVSAVIRLRAEKPASARTQLGIYAAASVVVLLLPLAAIPVKFDRHLLPAVPPLIVLVVLACRQPATDRFGSAWTVVGAALFLPMAAFSLAATHDYLADGRARAAALNLALARGYERSNINAGWVMNGWHLYGIVGTPYEIANIVSWHNDPKIVVDSVPWRGYHPVASVEVPRRLPWAWGVNAPVYVMERDSPFDDFIGPRAPAPQ